MRIWKTSRVLSVLAWLSNQCHSIRQTNSGKSNLLTVLSRKTPRHHFLNYFQLKTSQCTTRFKKLVSFSMWVRAS